MITAVVGAGGKTTLIHSLAARYRAEGKRVFVTTSTHMYTEPDTLLTDDAPAIIRQLTEQGYAMAGIPEGEKITALSRHTYEAVCAYADEVLIEADGSKHMPIKYPIPGEPVIWDNVEHIIIVVGLHALDKPAKEAAFRLEAVKEFLRIGDDTPITPEHIQKLVFEGYAEKLKALYPDKTQSVYAAGDGSALHTSLKRKLEAPTAYTTGELL